MIHYTKSQGEFRISDFADIKEFFRAVQNSAGGCYIRHIAAFNSLEGSICGNYTINGSIFARECKLIGLASSEQMKVVVTVFAEILETYPDGRSGIFKRFHEYFFDVIP